MPFITQGKVNIKYLLIVVLVAAVAGGIIFTTWNYYQKEIISLNGSTEIKKQELVRDQNKMVPNDTELIKTIPQCKTKNTLEEVAFSDSLSARIEECDDGTSTYSIMSIIKNNKEEILKIRKIIGMDDYNSGMGDGPFYGFKDIEFLSENYLIHDYSFWETSNTVIYDLQAQKNVLSFRGSIKKTGDGKHFFTYGGGMGTDSQLKLYNMSNLELVKDFSTNEEAPLSFNDCSEENGIITCERYDGKALFYDIK